jgi:AMP phosphorylase
MTKALIANGKQLEFKKTPVVDKHCIGGINGRTSMILVPIVAAAGLTIPKTASRAITSAAGTADSMDCLANSSLSVSQLKKVVEKTNGCIAWGGSLGLAPADDKIIRIEYPLKLDPEGQVIASVMAKKASVGAKFVVIDLPVGPEVKVQNAEKAKLMAEKFVEVGKQLGLKIEVLITDGSEPSGPAFGPALEARHALQILEGKVFDNLAQKACELSGALFELVGVSKIGEGFEKARGILQSGKALEKMMEIIEAQGGKKIISEKVKIGSYKREIFSKAEGIIKSANLKKITTVAREAGAPSDKGAGVLLKAMPGEKAKKGQLLFEIYADNQRKLEAARNLAESIEALELEKIIIERVE